MGGDFFFKEMEMKEEEMNSKVMCSVLGILVCLTIAVPAVTAQSTPFMIYGNVFDRDTNPCDGSTVLITNLNTGASWYAENVSDSNYYQRLLVKGSEFNVSEILQIQVTSPDGIQSNIVEHTVTTENVSKGGMFNINITLMYPDQQTWYLTSMGKPEGVPPMNDGLTHITDNRMQKGMRGGTDESFNITYPEVAWFYADVGAESDIGFGEKQWEVHIRTGLVTGRQVNKSFTVEICRLAKETGDITVIANHTEKLTGGTSRLRSIICEDNPDTGQDFCTGDWLAVKLFWDDSSTPLAPLQIYYKPEAGSDSYIASPYTDPGYPIPELSTVVLFGLGLLMVVGYVGLIRKRLRSK